MIAVMSRGFDIVVIGGGHAGAEAAWASAQLGARTALVTFRRDAIGRMSCNPAIGGIGKGQMVREIDALGGLMGLVADRTGIQFRMLNRRKGPAMWAPRCQSDSSLYSAAVREVLEQCSNLTILEAGVDSLLSEPRRSRSISQANTQNAVPAILPERRITGVLLQDGSRLEAAAVVVTGGTFLGALMHCGEEKTAGGRIGEPAAVGLSESLRALGLKLGRLKTGTPPRIARDSVDFTQLTEQAGDHPPAPFSFLNDSIPQSQVCCWITYTNPEVHELLRANLHRAPMYSGQIAARGPRYCPSIEDKVVRFADKTQHQLFLEPEGRDSERIYCNGISTSTPRDVQAQILALIPGLRRARVLQWGYAVEYDFVPPEQIHASLMARRINGLFLAGQINGTSGYEEAAGQGLIAGINATRWLAKQPPLVLRRDQAYVGVMIDDLVTRGVTEPYRMFTSRAEYRLHLRYDNADQRLTPLGRDIGLVKRDRWLRFEDRARRLAELRSAFRSLRLEGAPLERWLRNPDENGERFLEPFPHLRGYYDSPDVWASAIVDVKYAGYIERQDRSIAESKNIEAQELPADLDFRDIPHLRREAQERWTAQRPSNVGQAARLSGIHPTDVTMLMLFLRAGVPRTEFPE